MTTLALLLACADPAADIGPQLADDSVMDAVDSSVDTGEPEHDPCAELEVYPQTLALTSVEAVQDFGARYRAVQGSLILMEVEGLRDLDALDCLEEVDEVLSLRGHAELAEVRLPALRRAGWLKVQDNPTLVSLEAATLRELGSLQVDRNAALTEVQLPALAEVDFSVELSRNEQLDRAALPALELVGASLVVADARLADLDGLAGLGSIGGGLVLRENAELVDLQGLHGLQSVDRDLSIVDNTQLPQAEIEALLEAIGSVGGSVETSGNAG